MTGSWPPDYATAGATPADAGPFPPASWPTLGQLDYLKTLITAALLTLALPWLVMQLLTNPGYVFAGAGRRQLHAPS